MHADLQTRQPTVSGTTSLIGIIGDPVSKVRSTEVVNALLARKGFDSILIPVHVRAHGLRPLMQALKCVANLKGIVVTTPHKAAVLPFLDRWDGSVSAVGGCNLIRVECGRLLGINGDGEGFVRGLNAQGHCLSGRDVYLVGAGPAAAAMAFAIATAGARRLTLSNRTVAKAERIADVLAMLYPGLVVSVDRDRNIRGHDVVINGTSLGMQSDDPLPIDVLQLQPGMLVAEIIGMPDKTPLLLAAEQHGCTVHPGVHVLNGQLDLMLDFLLAEKLALDIKWL